MKGLFVCVAICLVLTQLCHGAAIVKKRTEFDSLKAIEDYDKNAEMCLGETGYPCKTDADCDGLSQGSCATICNDLMGVCYLKTAFSEQHFEKK